MAVSEDRTYSWKTHRKILKEMDFSAAKRVVDIGCRECRFFDELKGIAPEAEMLGVEPDKISREKARSKGYRVVEPKRLASLGRGFDFVTMVEVIEHLEKAELENYLAWAAHALNSRGWLVISTPNTKNLLMLYHFWDSPDHKRPYTTSAIRDLAEQFGFDFVKEVGVNYWVNPLKVAVNLMLGLENCCNKLYFLQKKGQQIKH